MYLSINYLHSVTLVGGFNFELSASAVYNPYLHFFYLLCESQRNGLKWLCKKNEKKNVNYLSFLKLCFLSLAKCDHSRRLGESALSEQ